MEGYFFQLIAFGIVYKMYQAVYVERLAWFLFAILFIPDHFPLFSTTIASRFFIFSLMCIFILKNYNNLIKKIKSFPLKYSWGAVLIGFIITSIADVRLKLDFVKIILWGGGFFLDNFLVVFLCYNLIKTFDDLIRAYKIILLFFGVLSVYGIYNIVTRDNFYMSIISNVYGVRDLAEVYMSGRDGRFRISSFTWHPIYYGFVLGMGILMSLLLLISIKLKTLSKRVYLCILLGVIVNLLFVNSRTPFFSLIAGLLIFLVFGLDLQKKLRFTFIAIGLSSILLTSVPKFSEFVNDSLDTFSSKGSKLEGSSVEMRNMQLDAALLIFSKNPVTGNGIDYIITNLGFSSEVENRVSDSDFAGFESYLYKMLIEQGLIGIVSQTVFILSIMFYLVGHTVRSKSTIRKQFAILNIAMLCCFLLFIFGTGDLGTFKIYFSILGINLKGLESLKMKEQAMLAQNAAILDV
ncbi:O-antigen ligase [Arcicella rosea]|uniref:O-antigen ligase n=1 Tax=Arcicella rosea TaxID=502909 RepID=A0A841EHF2_9BACT|nr:O-antigen ligase family protein [Arcicella rosea]MBB6002416.1 O-antigen ligase [Arcicella rosea]